MYLWVTKSRIELQPCCREDRFTWREQLAHVRDRESAETIQRCPAAVLSRERRTPRAWERHIQLRIPHGQRHKKAHAKRRRRSGGARIEVRKRGPLGRRTQFLSKRITGKKPSVWLFVPLSNQIARPKTAKSKLQDDSGAYVCVSNGVAGWGVQYEMEEWVSYDAFAWPR